MMKLEYNYKIMKLPYFYLWTRVNGIMICIDIIAMQIWSE